MKTINVRELRAAIPRLKEELAAEHELVSSTERFALRDANLALARLRAGQISGAAVLDCR